ncbi:hypothetical protein BJ138DRAFT_1186017 [Hygrophoropsis aurantiaca]|uniref:Uncharacterized protein n=1 Tax=Hygrophoropsis aurantiaca TaxID=72124 RepID=A0ACB7ZTJ2_9AGAM|nr:hypothetical protein BJ138DRAFT_1186017 [Hygrophoropsis aurantiaca]
MAFVNKTLNRITFNVLEELHVDWLRDHPIVLDHRSYYVSHGCKEIQGAQAHIDAYIKQKYGNIIALSRLVLNGDVYTVIFKSPEFASRFLTDRFNAFEENSPFARFFATSAPFLLFDGNTAGLPSNPAFMSSQQPDNSATSSDIRDIRAEMSEQRNLTSSALASANTLATQYGAIVREMKQQGERMTSTLSVMSTSLNTMSWLTIVQSSLEALRSERNSLRAIRLANPQVAPELDNQLNHISSAIIDKEAQLNNALRDSAQTEQMLLPSLTLPATRPVTPTGPTSSTSTSASNVAQSSSHVTDQDDPMTSAEPAEPSVQNPNTTTAAKRQVIMNSDVIASTHLTPSNPIAPYKDINSPTEFLNKNKRVSQVYDSVGILSFASRSNVLSIIFLFLIMLAFVLPCVQASAPFQSFAINANGLRDVMKISAISDAISDMRPHSWVICETKSSLPAAHRISAPEYQTFESLGVHTSARSAKWGIIMGVRRNIAAQVLTIDQSLSGRVLVVDVVIPTDARRGYPHRLVGVYAPWDPGENNADLISFWTQISNICNDAPYSWSLIGDCNATVSSAESLADPRHHSPNRDIYSNFISDTGGIDLWSIQPDRHASNIFTYKGNGGQSIIDRAVHSPFGVLTASVQIPRHFIGATDHRPLLSSLVLLPPSNDTNTFLSSEQSNPLPARFRFPKRNERYRLHQFSQRVDELCTSADLSSAPIISETSFLARYNQLSTFLLRAAEDCFEKTVFNQPRSAKSKVSNHIIRLLVRENRRIGRILFALKQHPSYFSHFLSNNLWARHYQSSYLQTPADTNRSFHKFLTDARSSIAKLRYREEKLELQRRSRQSSKARINATLLGSSAKKLYPSRFMSSGPPLALIDEDNPQSFITNPDDVKRYTAQYFSDLFTRKEREGVPKPWLDTPSVRSIRHDSAILPFEWPLAMTLNDFKTILRKGNARPAPGPDQWEKWQIKVLSDSGLQLVLDLVNYEIIHSSFPDAVKPSTLSTLHKRNSKMDLTNYRGVCCSNFLLNTPFAWLNARLTDYVARRHILPPGQIATQPGVQGRDLLSFYAQLESWSNRTNSPLFALRRDQNKGFDRLEPEGFYDAINAYGLPSSIIAFDQSAQRDVPYQIKTAYGLTNTIIVSGVTKQGGPLSPLKSTLTTSLGSYWLYDCSLAQGDALIVATTSARHNEFHTPDPSYLFADPVSPWRNFRQLTDGLHVGENHKFLC